MIAIASIRTTQSLAGRGPSTYGLPGQAGQ
jgi:hypothetical protein